MTANGLVLAGLEVVEILECWFGAEDREAEFRPASQPASLESIRSLHHSESDRSVTSVLLPRLWEARAPSGGQ